MKGGIMNYITSVEFFDWLMWDKEISEWDWVEASDEAKEAMFKEFQETRRKRNE